MTSENTFEIFWLVRTRDPHLSDHPQYTLRKKIKDFANLSGKEYDNNVFESIHHIANHMDDALTSTNPQDYIQRHKENINQHLNTLSKTNDSWVNSALNVLTLILAYGSIIGLLCLWCSGNLMHNEKTKGSKYMFFSFGEKQTAQALVHEVAHFTCAGALLAK